MTLLFITSSDGIYAYGKNVVTEYIFLYIFIKLINHSNMKNTEDKSLHHTGPYYRMN